MQDETTDTISEAVAILKSWNNKWKPLAFMVDNCDEEINAIEEHFSGSNNNTNAVCIQKSFTWIKDVELRSFYFKFPCLDI